MMLGSCGSGKGGRGGEGRGIEWMSYICRTVEGA